MAANLEFFGVFIILHPLPVLLLSCTCIYSNPELTCFHGPLAELFSILCRVFHRAEVLNFDKVEIVNLFL